MFTTLAVAGIITSLAGLVSADPYHAQGMHHEMQAFRPHHHSQQVYARDLDLDEDLVDLFIRDSDIEDLINLYRRKGGAGGKVGGGSSGGGTSAKIFKGVNAAGNLGNGVGSTLSGVAGIVNAFKGQKQKRDAFAMAFAEAETEAEPEIWAEGKEWEGY